jgi:hypothetical protein
VRITPVASRISSQRRASKIEQAYFDLLAGVVGTSCDTSANFIWTAECLSETKLIRCAWPIRLHYLVSNCAHSALIPIASVFFEH